MKTKARWALAAAALILGAAFIVARPERSGSALPLEGIAPSFKLEKAGGEAFTSESLRGKTWGIYFFFTSCPATCPVITENVATLRRQLDHRDLEFVGISVDPKHDTAEVLENFKNEHGVDWILTRGEKAEVLRIAELLLKKPMPGEAAAHSNRLVIVDRDFNLRGSYLFLEPHHVADIKTRLRSLL